MTSTKLVFALCYLVVLLHVLVAIKQNVPDSSGAIEVIGDVKAWKKVLETRTNVLALYSITAKPISFQLRTVLQQANAEIRGIGTIIHILCTTPEGRKLCRKSKDIETLLENQASGNSPGIDYTLKHYQNGDFHKNFDRLETVRSIVNFMRDPSGPVPFEEDASMQSVVNVEGARQFEDVILRSKLPVALYIYAPWCIECQRGRGPIAQAASDLKGEIIVAAFNAESPSNTQVRNRLNIGGYPSLVYFENGQGRFAYSGVLSREGIVEWLRRPTPARLVEQQSSEQLAAQRGVTPDFDWTTFDSDDLDVLALPPVLRSSPIRIRSIDERSYAATISASKSVVVLFYAPWCPHSKRLKPEFQKAAVLVDSKKMPIEFYAINGDQNEALIHRMNVQTFPSIRYYRDGQYLTDISERKAEQIINILSQPQPYQTTSQNSADDQQSSDFADDQVQILDTETFKSIRKRKHSIVMFFAPWCVHCYAAKTHFAKAAGYFRDMAKVQFFALDCTESAGICVEHNITSYPSFLYFQYGKLLGVFDAQSPPELPNLVSFVADRASADIADSKLPPFSEYLASVGPLPPPATHIQRPKTSSNIEDLLADEGTTGSDLPKQLVSASDVEAVKNMIVDPAQQPALLYLYRENCYQCFETVQRISYSMQRLQQLTPQRVAFVALSVDKFPKFDAREIAAMLSVNTLPALRYLKDGTKVDLPVGEDVESTRHAAWADKLLEFLTRDMHDHTGGVLAEREEL